MNHTDSIEIAAATVEQAIQEALEKLGAAQDDVVIEVLATPRSGVLGLGARQAKVRVTRRPPVEARSGVTAPPPAPPPRREPPPRAEAPSRTEAPPRREPRPPAPARSEAPRGEERRAPQRAPEPAAEAEEGELSAETALEDTGDVARRSANADEQAREAIAILERLFELMNEKAEIRRLEADPESIELEIKGDGSGILIGRHGQTLDSLEYLLNRIVARRIKDAIPILLDAELYRARRRQQLHRMALSMGERAKREHEPMRLDPMPPRERRVIHLALKDDPLVTTRSAGEGFLRSVEIVPVEGGRERSGGGREGKRGREPEKDRDHERPAPGEQGGFKHGQKKIF